MFRFLKKLGFMKKRKSGLEIKVIRNNESFDVDIVDATDAELFECCEFVDRKKLRMWFCSVAKRLRIELGGKA